MSGDPFEEFRKKKEAEKVAENQAPVFERPISEDGTGKILTHRFPDIKADVHRPKGFEPTQLGDALHEERPQIHRPKGFESTNITEQDTEDDK